MSHRGTNKKLFNNFLQIMNASMRHCRTIVRVGIFDKFLRAAFQWAWVLNPISMSKMLRAMVIGHIHQKTQVKSEKWQNWNNGDKEVEKGAGREGGQCGWFWWFRRFQRGENEDRNNHRGGARVQQREQEKTALSTSSWWVFLFQAVSFLQEQVRLNMFRLDGMAPGLAI